MKKHVIFLAIGLAIGVISTSIYFKIQDGRFAKVMIWIINNGKVTYATEAAKALKNGDKNHLQDFANFMIDQVVASDIDESMRMGLVSELKDIPNEVRQYNDKERQIYKILTESRNKK